MSRIQNKKIEVRHVTIDAGQEDRRIDNFLIGSLKGLPKARIYQMLRKGEIRVNGGRVKQAYRLQAGDVLRIPPVHLTEGSRQGRPGDYLVEMVRQSLVYEDEDMILVNKPPGIVVHGGSGRSFGVIEVLRYLRDDAGDLQLAHRLDRETSGCLLIAKHMKALTYLQRLMQADHVEKHYVALLSGIVSKSSLEITAPMSKNVLCGGERVVTINEKGKAARTLFNIHHVYQDATLVDVRLFTGRTHQIRVHAGHMGHPVAGDRKYGDKVFNREMRKKGLKRTFLHAAKLSFPSPEGHGKMNFSAPLPEDLQHVINTLEQRQ